jgi:hypothetical protein
MPIMVFSETRRLIIALAGSGRDTQFIAQELGVSRQRIYQHLEIIAGWYAERRAWQKPTGDFREFVARHSLDMLAIERPAMDRIRALFPLPATTETKLAARAIVNDARSRGKLPVTACGLCNAAPEQHFNAHHTDYSKPLSVTFLCVSCHATVHYYHRQEVAMQGSSTGHAGRL